MFLEKDFASMIDILTDRVYMPQSELTISTTGVNTTSQIYRYWNFEVSHIPIEDENKTRRIAGSIVMDSLLVDFTETSKTFTVTVRNF